MNTISISQLKINPSKVINLAGDYPVAVEKRNKVKAYLVGKDLFEKIVDYIEDYTDRKAVEQTDFKKGHDFEKVALQLGI
ncbi:prevent-host-death protein [Candidatus Roizmanbacteria bacterium CG02_land_8_20_14_3_00_36_15]|uniref:Antitoxin n=1 Tax=Candidatus Roizmanbacteria bacterium CG10_big_fil_rev_8_21_14_0_10_36_26 TaxID=1974851 RepID=A0A2M8KLZ9_9BACT|nr:MAG: prevent-host-death protein [Candidatus Roizmanbacteria bacterium CG03_land_8_20_14_0_80_36_21]PIV37961.1 MAG: prevent-host-death protein [Candidatus Roizmanbacteria bacterium CG02_land_8_20_14_3_00_36_15]PIY69962.1 MAG: prevent-host-death protein [Candidatus Roizmanbacteria bacterium CG_4_10_14_0_8_um_filter_36_36]PJA52547.1 MAG: prevent-host-death protein [Candidatus Roizmanbacteria bacterium CG_4_9_14_3_um_filter_36_11]PJE60938.1 MAG: prevent-host-death protein [Candidatus Roizmanbact